MVTAQLRRAAIGLAACVSLACNRQPPPSFGEALFVVDTDLPVPSVANRLRIDVYGSDGTWFYSRDDSLPDPSDWPASFGVFAGDTPQAKDVLVRLRVYADGNVRDYRGERYEPPATFTEPFVAKSVADLCANKTELRIGSTLTVRRGRQHISPSFKGGQCSTDRISNAVGSAGAYVRIAEPGTYCFGALSTTEGSDGNVSPFQQVTLQLRRDCADANSWVACDDGVIDFNAPTFQLPRIEQALDPGTYYVVLSSGVPDYGPTDVVIAAAQGTCAQLPPLPFSAPTLHDPGTPIFLNGDPGATPAQEPEPIATVDRLVLVHLRYGERPAFHVTLHGACAGTMAKLGDGGVDFTTATTCVDADDMQVAVTDDTPESSGPAGSAQGTFAPPADCGDPDPTRDAICIPGGPFLFGSKGGQSLSTPDPPRIAAVSTFWMDRTEITVARLRAAFAKGLTFERPEDIRQDSGVYCTVTTSPGAYEGYAASCTSWYGARAFCQFVGGDLPTEAQWDFAATMGGGSFKRTYAWGEDAPRCTCDGAPDPCHAPIFGRADDTTPTALPFCGGNGPAPVDAASNPDTGDVSALGVVNLDGDLAEWILDSAQPVTSACWQAAGVVDPECWEANAPLRILRGGNFSAAGGGILPSDRHATFVGGVYDQVGFRCVYPVGSGSP